MITSLIESKQSSSKTFSMCKKTRHALTAIELLVIIVVIVILLALLIPSIHSARESSRRLLCKNNLKQIGLGISGYIDTTGFFPRGRLHSIDHRYMADPSISCSGPLDRSYLVALLPWLEQDNLYSSLNHQLSIFGAEHATSNRQILNFYICPNDPDAGVLREGRFDYRIPNNISYGRSSFQVWGASYGACQGSLSTYACEDISFGCKIRPARFQRANGCITDVPNVSLSSVTDGFSNTMLVAEKSISVFRVIENEYYGNNALAYCGFWFSGDFPDSIFSCQYKPNSYKSILPSETSRLLLTASSLHPGGLNILLADGSVRFVKETIQSLDFYTEGKFGIWQMLGSRNGGELIDNASY